MTDREYDEILLIQRYLDDGLTERDEEEFLALLHQDGRFVDRVEKHFEADFLLRLRGRIQNKTRDGQSPALRTLLDYYTPVASASIPEFDDLETLDPGKLVRLAAESKAIERPSEAERRTSPRTPLTPYKPLPQRETRRLRWIVLLIVSFAASAIYFEFSPRTPEQVEQAPPRNAPVIARITGAASAVFPPDSQPARPGQTLGETEIRLQSGLLELETVDGVRLVLDGPAVLHLHSGMKVFCGRGRLSAEVPEGSEGFEIRTPLMFIRDLGTALVVEVSEEENAVHVIKGAVEVNRLYGRASTLEEGDGMRSRPGGQDMQIPADKTLYIGRTAMSQAVGRYESERLSRWSEERKRWSGDPSLLLDLDFESSVSALNIQIRGDENVQGRWRGKKATAFRSRKDGIDVELSEEPRSWTLFASVKANALRRFHQVLFAGKDDGNGRVVWQLHRDGSFNLLVRHRMGRKTDFYRSEAAFHEGRCGTWRPIAVTYDSEKEKVVFYLDGNRIGEQEMQTSEPPRFDRLMLGNDFLDYKTASELYLDGRMDLFLMFGRALEDEEIINLSALY